MPCFSNASSTKLPGSSYASSMLRSSVRPHMWVSALYQLSHILWLDPALWLDPTTKCQVVKPVCSSSSEQQHALELRNVPHVSPDIFRAVTSGCGYVCCVSVIPMHVHGCIPADSNHPECVSLEWCHHLCLGLHTEHIRAASDEQTLYGHEPHSYRECMAPRSRNMRCST